MFCFFCDLILFATSASVSRVPLLEAKLIGNFNFKFCASNSGLDVCVEVRTDTLAPSWNSHAGCMEYDGEIRSSCRRSLLQAPRELRVAHFQ